MKDLKPEDGQSKGTVQFSRMGEIRELLDMFRWERFVYLAVTFVSVAVLLGCAIALLLKPNSSISAVIGLFGSSGGITYSTGRLLKMWSDAIQLLQQKKNGL